MKKLLLAGAVALLAAACSNDNNNAVVFPDFTGTFVMTGSVDGSPNSAISGDIIISNQSGSQADLMQSTTFSTNGQQLFTVVTTAPVTAAIQPNGRLAWTVNTGSATFAATGTLSGNQITGTWTFASGGTNVSGQFTAVR